MCRRIRRTGPLAIPSRASLRQDAPEVLEPRSMRRPLDDVLVRPAHVHRGGAPRDVQQVVGGHVPALCDAGPPVPLLALPPPARWLPVRAAGRRTRAAGRLPRAARGARGGCRHVGEVHDASHTDLRSASRARTGAPGAAGADGPGGRLVPRLVRASGRVSQRGVSLAWHPRALRLGDCARGLQARQVQPRQPEEYVWSGMLLRREQHEGRRIFV
mmetsp:Transcript_59639/g.193115  ORF Transcript_59639/g.193115 Transcript_59639/m.193115 type:complete len:215 (-) Transcript_59639:1268-1912(-)